MHDQKSINEELKRRIDNGETLEAAVKSLKESGVGTLFLSRSVAVLAQIELPMAQRLVIRIVDA